MNALRAWRGALSQARVAELLRVSRSTWQRWEYGKIEPPHLLCILISMVEPGQLDATTTKGKP